MKKRLLLTLLLPLAALASCGEEEGYVETRTEEEIIKYTATKLVNDLGIAYSGFSSDGVAPGNNKLYPNYTSFEDFSNSKGATLNGYKYSITYELEKGFNYLGNYVSLSNSQENLVYEPLTKQELASEKLNEPSSFSDFVAYYLKASIKFEGYENKDSQYGEQRTDTYVGQTISNTVFNVRCNPYVRTTIKQAKIDTENGVLNTNDHILVKGRYYGSYSTTYSDIYAGTLLMDGEDGILLYAGSLSNLFFEKSTDEAPKYNYGDLLYVSGAVSPYNGLFEIKPDSCSLIDESSIPVAERIPQPVVNDKTVPEIAACTMKSTGNMVKVSNIRLSRGLPELTLGAHWSITIADANNVETLLYINYHVTKPVQKIIREKLRAIGNKTFDITAMISAYNGVAQITPIFGSGITTDNFITIH